MCVLSLKEPIRKKSGNIFNDPGMNLLNASRTSECSEFQQWNPYFYIAVALQQL